VELYLHPTTPSWRGAQLKHRDNMSTECKDRDSSNTTKKLQNIGTKELGTTFEETFGRM
jgi:hypothetical protein